MFALRLDSKVSARLAHSSASASASPRPPIADVRENLSRRFPAVLFKCSGYLGRISNFQEAASVQFLLLLRKSSKEKRHDHKNVARFDLGKEPAGSTGVLSRQARV